jgi:Flp pilus assembly protein TadG
VRILARLGTSGATALEFALLAPAALTLLLGTMEVGRLLWVWNTLEQGVAVAGRYAMTHPNASGSDVAAAARAGMYGIDTGDVTVTTARETVGPVTYMTVAAGYDFRFLPLPVPTMAVPLATKARVPLL